MKYGKVEERSSLRSRSPNTVRRAATSAILTDILSRSDRAPASRTADLGGATAESKLGSPVRPSFPNTAGFSSPADLDTAWRYAASTGSAGTSASTVRDKLYPKGAFSLVVRGAAGA